jgi:hypothetical protein
VFVLEQRLALFLGCSKGIVADKGENSGGGPKAAVVAVVATLTTVVVTVVVTAVVAIVAGWQKLLSQ